MQRDQGTTVYMRGDPATTEVFDLFCGVCVLVCKRKVVGDFGDSFCKIYLGFIKFGILQNLVLCTAKKCQCEPY